jgi:hypothetical protein
MGVTVAGRQLDHAQGIAVIAQAHGLGIDRDLGAEVEAVGQVAFVEIYGHVLPLDQCAPSGERDGRVMGEW